MPKLQVTGTHTVTVDLSKREIGRTLRDIATGYIRTPTRGDELRIEKLGSKGTAEVIVGEDGHVLVSEGEALILLKAALILERDNS